MERQPCSQQDTCRLRDSKLGCREDVHHLFFPRRDYRKGLAREFRELEENKVRICRAEHERRHATEPIPEKPSADEMRTAIALSKLVLEQEHYEQPEVDGGVAVVSTDSSTETLADNLA
jgi:hypothetical protein